MNFLKTHNVYFIAAALIGITSYISLRPAFDTEDAMAKFPSGYSCPSEYATTQEIVDSLASFLSELQKMYPDITTDQAIAMRDEWFALKKCEIVQLAEPVEPYGLKCPDDYTNSEEKLADFNRWQDWFYDNNPGASISDMSDARGQFYIEHDCQKAIQRALDYSSGNMDPKTMESIEKMIEETL